MCLDEYGLCFRAGSQFVTRERDFCNKDLSLSRGLVCQALKSIASESSRELNCLDGNSACGLMGMLWKKYLGVKINVEINGLFPHTEKVIKANLKSNNLETKVLYDDPCVLLRKKCYDFIFLNCKTSASHYMDSVFSKANNNTVLAITTSEDPSLYWQSANLALRNYGGVIVRTSYFRELGIRLVIAELVRAAARYGKGLRVLCCASFKAQQSFTIIVRVEKAPKAAVECLSAIKRLLHCRVCEDRHFLPNSEFAVETPASLLSCECSKNSLTRVVNELGPVWSGTIFCPKFVELMLSTTDRFPWELKTKCLLMQILDEAKCGKCTQAQEPEEKKQKMDQDDWSRPLQPSFYFNTHRHHPSCCHILKISSIIKILQKGGFRASRTHFDPESVRTDASLRDYIKLLEQH